MKTLVKIAYIITSLLFIVYLLVPTNDYPMQIPDSVQSQEPGDTETTLRKAYFTNFNRAEVISHYLEQFSKKLFLPTLLLNYPPEDAQIFVRDQTMSSYLQELVQPMKSSFFINGFIPQSQKDTIIINGVNWQQKVTVVYTRSNVVVRIIIGVAAIFIFKIVLGFWFDEIKALLTAIKNLKLKNFL